MTDRMSANTVCQIEQKYMNNITVNKDSQYTFYCLVELITSDNPTRSSSVLELGVVIVRMMENRVSFNDRRMRDRYGYFTKRT